MCLRFMNDFRRLIIISMCYLMLLFNCGVFNGWNHVSVVAWPLQIEIYHVHTGLRIAVFGFREFIV